MVFAVFICFGRLNMEICDWEVWFSHLVIEFVKWGSYVKSLVRFFVVFCLALFRSLFKIYRIKKNKYKKKLHKIIDSKQKITHDRI